MTDAFSVEITGIEELNKNLKAAAKKLTPDAIEPIMKRGVEQMANAVRGQTPRGRTGNLQRSVVAKTLSRRFETDIAPSMVGFKGRVRGPGAHAHLVEFGHKGPHPAGAHAFFFPAVNIMAPSVVSQITEEIKQAVEGAVS